MQNEKKHLNTVMNLAESAVALCKKVWKIELDYTLGSLGCIDEAIEKMREFDNPDQKEISFALVCLGCYAGEVIIRHSGGAWLDEVDANGLPVGLKAGSVTTNPIKKTFRRYREGEEHVILHYAACTIVVSSTFQNQEPANLSEKPG